MWLPRLGFLSWEHFFMEMFKRKCSSRFFLIFFEKLWWSASELHYFILCTLHKHIILLNCWSRTESVSLGFKKLWVKKLSKIPQAQPFKNAQHQENMWERQDLKTCHNKKLYSCIGPLYKNNVVIHISKGLFYFKKLLHIFTCHWFRCHFHITKKMCAASFFLRLRQRTV